MAKMALLGKDTCRSRDIPMNIPAALSAEIDELIRKIHYENGRDPEQPKQL